MDASVNIVVLIGTVSRDPETRDLPPGSALGSQVVSFDLSTVAPDGRAEAVPVSCIDPPAAVAQHRAGEELVVAGRVRRRFFRAGGVTQSRTEVVAEQIVPLRHVKRSRSALERVRVAVAAQVDAVAI
jgi:single-strand DNA-binding protein